jgi:hypothetical protein
MMKMSLTAASRIAEVNPHRYHHIRPGLELRLSRLRVLSAAALNVFRWQVNSGTNREQYNACIRKLLGGP